MQHTLHRWLALWVLTASSIPAAALASNEYERGYRDGYENGYRESYDRGFEAGRTSAQREFQNEDRQRQRDRDRDRDRSSGSRHTTGIAVLGASYGDGRRSCDLTTWAVQQFNRRTSGSAEVNNNLCGDPAPGERKSLQIEYICRGKTKTVSAYEHRTLTISCD